MSSGQLAFKGNMEELMQPETQTSVRMIWAGRIISGLVALFMIFDAVLHLLKPVPVAQAFAELQYPLKLSVALGVIELFVVAVYVVPRTAVLGAILLTGYLGGAIATQLRVGHPLFGETLFPVYVGILAWAGVFLRESRVRALLPLRSANAKASLID